MHGPVPRYDGRTDASRIARLQAPNQLVRNWESLQWRVRLVVTYFIVWYQFHW